jgi:site-specific DNA-methyltransferase (adenine-specific)
MKRFSHRSDQTEQVAPVHFGAQVKRVASPHALRHKPTSIPAIRGASPKRSLLTPDDVRGSSGATGVRRRTLAKNTLSFSCSKSMQYIRTPTDIWAQLKREFRFTVDVCASEANHLLPRYYTVETDGLAQDLTGEVAYCHPMFDYKIPKWVKKGYESKCTMVFLLPAATHTKYFHEYILNNPRAEVRFLRKPVRGFRFLNDDGSPDDGRSIGYISPLMIVVMRNGQ